MDGQSGAPQADLAMITDGQMYETLVVQEFKVATARDAMERVSLVDFAWATLKVKPGENVMLGLIEK